MESDLKKKNLVRNLILQRKFKRKRGRDSDSSVGSRRYQRNDSFMVTSYVVSSPELTYGIVYFIQT